MKIYQGTVTGSEIKINKDGDIPVILLQATLTSDDDPQTIEYISQPGEESRPEDGTEVIVLAISEGYKIAIACDNRIEPTMKKGEKKLFSMDNGSIAAFMNFLKNGNIEINGNSRNAARQNDSTISTSLEDSIFWTWISQAAPILASLGVAAPPPTSLTGKINQGTDKVKLP